MRPITFRVSALLTEGQDAVTPREKATLLVDLLHILEEANDNYIKCFPSTPPLYDAGIVYEHETRPENWMDIGAVTKQKWADCKNLASWRAAELRADKIPARAVIKWRTDGTTIFHVVVVRAPIPRNMPPGLPNKRFLRPYKTGEWIEDPSAVLGM